MLKTASKQYKFVLVGDSAVGKSSLLNQFVQKTFSQSLMSTIGVDFKFKKIRIDNNDIKLQIWDTAGQQTFRSIVSAYYSSADAIVIVYDVTSYESFENLKSYWIGQAQNNNKNKAKIYLIGNKIDQQSRRQVQRFTIDTFLEEHNIQGVFQASAKTGQNVQETFIQIAKSLYFGVKSPKSLGHSVNKVQKSEKKGSKKIQSNKKSIHQQYSNQEQNQRADQYQQVVSVDQQVRKQKKQLVRNQQKQDKNKISLQKTNRPKNPNYNKSCCLK